MNNFNMTIGSYVKRNSVIHKLDPRFKILAVIVLMVAIFLIPANSFNSMYYLLGILGLFLAVILMAKINLFAVIKGLQPVIFIGVFTFLLQVIYNPTGNELFSINFVFSWINILIAVTILLIWFFTSKYAPIKGLYMIFMIALIVLSFIFVSTSFNFFEYNFSIYSDGLFKGIFFVLRLILIVMLSSILTMTTSTTDINLGLEWVLKPFSIIKLPVSEIAMMLSLTLRFIPTLLIETDKIMKAQASRGIDFNEGNLLEKVKQIVALLIPMFFVSITRAEDLANAMESRGYVVGAKRTSVDELKFRVKDYIGMFFVLSILAFTIIIKVI